MDELIKHYSSEVTTLLNNIFLFRSRTVFTVWVAPYLVLGAYTLANRGQKITLDLAEGFSSLAIWLLVGSYFVFGFLAGMLEGYLWDRVDDLNKAIKKLSGVGAETAKDPRNNKWRDAIIGYLIVFWALIISFAAMIGLAQIVIK